METPSRGPLVPRLLESFLFFRELSGVEPGAGASLSVNLLLPKPEVLRSLKKGSPHTLSGTVPAAHVIAGLDVLPLAGEGVPLPSRARQHAATPPGCVRRAALAACPVPIGIPEVTVLQGTTSVGRLFFRHGRVAALLLVSSVKVDLGRGTIVPVERSVSARVSGGVSVAHFDNVLEER